MNQKSSDDWDVPVARCKSLIERKRRCRHLCKTTKVCSFRALVLQVTVLLEDLDYDRHAKTYTELFRYYIISPNHRNVHNLTGWAARTHLHSSGAPSMPVNSCGPRSHPKEDPAHQSLSCRNPVGWTMPTGRFVVASGRGLSEGYGDDGPGVCPGDG